MQAPPVPPNEFALLLDFDGTLVELADTPDSVHVPSALRLVLQQLFQKLNGALACISGRSYADLSALLASTGIDLVGSHGAEMKGEQAADPVWAVWAQKCSHALQARWPQVLVESKPQGMAIHWRLCPEAEAAIRAWMAQHQPLWPGHRCIDGKCVIEIHVGCCDKGHAIYQLMQQPPYQGRLPIYIGDDTTDLAAFKAVQSLGGWSIAVGTKTAQAADFFLPDPQACRQWIAHLNQTLQMARQS